MPTEIYVLLSLVALIILLNAIELISRGRLYDWLDSLWDSLPDSPWAQIPAFLVLIFPCWAVSSLHERLRSRSGAKRSTGSSKVEYPECGASINTSKFRDQLVGSTFGVGTNIRIATKCPHCRAEISISVH